VANDEFREVHEERREHGLKARHETREARAVRKQVAEEIASAIEVRQHAAGRAVAYEALALAAKIAREIGARE
jgi:hypothetical protein